MAQGMADGTLRLRSEKVEWRTVEDEIVALTVDGDRYLGANRTGALLWQALVEGASHAQLEQVLLDEGAPADAAPADVDAFLDALRGRDLLSE